MVARLHYNLISSVPVDHLLGHKIGMRILLPLKRADLGEMTFCSPYASCAPIQINVGSRPNVIVRT